MTEREIQQQARIVELEEALREEILAFAKSILHGDQKHQDWLIDAACNWAPKALSVPAPQVSGITKGLQLLHEIYEQGNFIDGIPSDLWNRICRWGDILTPEERAFLERVE